MADVICPNCGEKMILDDQEYRFKGNVDNYYLCEKCLTTGFEKVRYGHRISIEIR